MTQPNLARYESLSVSPTLSALSRLCEAFSKDLKEAFPDAKGFAVSNLRYMRRYYELFPDFPIRPQVEGEIGDAAIRPQVSEEILPQVGAKIFMIPWNHVKCILDMC